MEYTATSSVELVPTFESAPSDEFLVYISEGEPGAGGSGPGSEGSGSSLNGIYRYGFNGKENDNEVKGLGNQQDYGMRIYDPRLGRFLSVDPLQKSFPFYTPYQFTGNSPISHLDPDGQERVYYQRTTDDQNKPSLLFLRSEDIVDRVLAGYRSSVSRFNDGAIPVYRKDVNKREEHVVVNDKEGVGYVDVNGGLNGARKISYSISGTYKTYNDALAQKDGVEGNERLGFYAMVGLQNINNQNRENAGAGMLVNLFGRTNQVAKATGAEMTTVGRWMSKEEYALMKSGTTVLEGAGGQTFVTQGGSHLFAGAARGSVYAEFQVPTNSLLQGGKRGWFKVLGPNASKSQKYLLQKQGGSLSPQYQNLSPIIKTK